jgi:hypothetical protein
MGQSGWQQPRAVVGGCGRRCSRSVTGCAGRGARDRVSDQPRDGSTGLV